MEDLLHSNSVHEQVMEESPPAPARNFLNYPLADAGSSATRRKDTVNSSS